ncbi:Por secretion system C-terminal sorting domain-containing protein [Mariniphaga anaerophila]|uniref:Por secretion system C-terminal sorting domain-containing protein n=1 Tax=Mariniphaga anaerophila TaxID=1484053 RepID=A0A1M5FJF8_9BACT|nr:discoidin domain-containing protein [Mariniphaga anaerophila]SHF91549.1 Por secretion system C-terminal sorting domain-containing protein [Mariniphaga anaerophila]
MKNLRTKLITTFFIMVTAIPLSFCQEITINIDEKQQQFYGGGGTFDNWNYLWLSMSPDNRDKAAKMIAGDLNIDYAKIYINGTPETVEKSYDDFVSIVNDVKTYKPNIKIQVSCNDFPDNLEEQDNEGQPQKGKYDPNIANIYQKIADYYFAILKGFSDRGLVVDELDLLNEAGGISNDNAIYYGRLFSEAIPLLKEKLNDAIQNPSGIIMPKVAGISNWSVGGTVKWFNEWKTKLPGAYENLDIVTTHGYSLGWIEDEYTAIYDYIEGKPFQNNEQTGKLQDGDGLKEIFGNEEPDYIGDVSIALRISDAVNGGVNHFFCFNMNNSSGNNAALLGTPNGGQPFKSKIYDGYKQLTSLQPDSSFVVGKKLSATFGNRVLCLRKETQDTVYLHYTNITATPELVTIDVAGAPATNGIKSFDVWVSNEKHDGENTLRQTYNKAVEQIKFNASPFSVNSLKIAIHEEGSETTLADQTIDFSSIPDQEVGAELVLTAFSSSGLPVEFFVSSGQASIENNTLSIDGAGEITVVAQQAGNNEYFAAKDVYQTFSSKSISKNIALNKTVTVSSIYKTDTGYTGDKAVDGDKTSNSSRWLSDKNGDYPHWIEVDFGEEYAINSMAFFVGHSGYNKPIANFEFQRWDGSEWVKIFDETGNEQAEYSKTYEPIKTSKVRLYMTAGNNPVRMFEIEVYGSEVVTGIHEHRFERSFKVFPNPASDQLNVELEQFKSVSVYSLSGLELITSEVKTINLAGFSKGVYIVKVRNNKGEVFQQKINLL